jgi:hypothetical protein
MIVHISIVQNRSRHEERRLKNLQNIMKKTIMKVEKELMKPKIT